MCAKKEGLGEEKHALASVRSVDLISLTRNSLMPLTRRRPLRARARIWRVLEAVRIAPRRMRGLQASTGAPLRRLLLVLKLLRSSDHATCHEETVINHPAQTCVALTTARKIVEQEHDQIRSADSDRGVEIPKAATTGIGIFEMLTHSIG